MEGENIIQGMNNPNQQNVINVRCPSCFKLYAVNESDIYVRKPKFACNKCDQKFWISYPECRHIAEILGYPEAAEINYKAEQTKPPQQIEPQEDLYAQKLSHSIESQIKSELKQKLKENPTQALNINCPNCGEKNKANSTECNSCGVVYAKYNQIQAEPMLKKTPQSKQLTSSWQQIMDNYGNEELHQAFIDLCVQLKMLNYAAHKYRQILKIDSGDPTAVNYKKQINALLMAQLNLEPEAKLNKVKTRFRWTFLIMALGLAMIVVGYFVPQLRNMIGVGVALTFLTMALRMTFR